MPPGTLKRTSTNDRDISPPPAKRKVAATTTNKAVANFFKPASAKEPEKITFHTIKNSLLVGRCEGATSIPRPQPIKVAAFDFDDTLVKTKSGKAFSLGSDDWQWWHASVPAKLKQLHADGHAIIVVSNQSGISLAPDPKTGGDMKALSNFKGKITAVFRSLDLPITLYAATEKDLYRKPRTGMWEQMLKDYGLEDHGDGGHGASSSASTAGSLVHESCVFVGDAAGREGDKVAKIRKDHSCSDRDFAANVGIPFQTPEEYFLGEAAKPFVRSFEPSGYVAQPLDSQTEVTPIVFTKKNDLDIVLFCGSPGAGKSTFYWQNMKPLGYERVNQDILKTRDRCLKVATECIQDKKSVVVDNTNADIETRSAWLRLAAKLHVPCRLVHFTSSAKLCEHNDTVRALSNGLMNPENRQLLPKMAFTSFASRFRRPTLEEGFQDITSVDFRLRGTEEEKALWGRYWIN
ncbi:unnamed protein product [Zymoseptoria tritici ST99CH_3D7]|uniref:Polynucleotide kinase 3'-phosphatase n=1 Tax=Zymoseptoria tritici (strain ST99CH_3D7) TaxID=1276538 RepID=A0A1X7S7Y0_ZYMT9|nr:unnamed protein product [Zymoseptoria tritici ST99CH_3D7]